MWFKKLPTVQFEEWKRNTESLIMKILKTINAVTMFATSMKKTLPMLPIHKHKQIIPPFIGVKLAVNQQVEMMQIPLIFPLLEFKKPLSSLGADGEELEFEGAFMRGTLGK